MLIVLVGAVLGMVLGLLGGGGGILAVPLLVAIGEPVLVASTMSLVVVATGAGAALVPHARAGRVDWRVGLTFGGLGAAGAVVGARLALLAPAWLLLAGLAVMLVVGSVLMLRAAGRARRAAARPAAVAAVTPAVVAAGGGHDHDHDHDHDEIVAGIELDAGLDDIEDPAALPDRAVAAWPRVILLASVVGVVTGFLGVGAGFVVVPALVAAMKVPMRRAAATALVVIVINSLAALVARHDAMGPWDLTLALAAVTAVFGALGAAVSHRVPAWMLSGAFGVLMLAVAAYTVVTAVLAA